MKNEPVILDGKNFSKEIESHVLSEVEIRIKNGLRSPGLAVVLVGDNPASIAYVKNKDKFAHRCKFITKQVNLPESCSNAEVKSAIEKLNSDKEIDGILLQLPLPKHLDTNFLIDCIDPKKDADGLTSVNQGKLIKGLKATRPCTPAGVVYVLNKHFAGDLSGKNAIVIGRSVLVGKPQVLLLAELNATVTLAHSKTKNLEKLSASCDIVVAACGVPRLVKKDWIKPGAVVIDVGINRLSDGTLCGDVDFSDVMSKCSAITPVPGGIGPMTVAMLIKNTLEICKSKD